MLATIHHRFISRGSGQEEVIFFSFSLTFFLKLAACGLSRGKAPAARTLPILPLFSRSWSTSSFGVWCCTISFRCTLVLVPEGLKGRELFLAFPWGLTLILINYLFSPNENVLQESLPMKWAIAPCQGQTQTEKLNEYLSLAYGYHKVFSLASATVRLSSCGVEVGDRGSKKLEAPWFIIITIFYYLKIARVNFFLSVSFLFLSFPSLPIFCLTS